MIPETGSVSKQVVCYAVAIRKPRLVPTSLRVMFMCVLMGTEWVVDPGALSGWDVQMPKWQGPGPK